MILLVDIGNTRIKWAVANGPALAPAKAVDHGNRPAECLSALDLPRTDAVWVSQVLGGAREAELAQALQSVCGIAPRFASPRAEYEGLRIAYAEPQRLGVDRWLAMLAAWRQLRAAFCAVNAGTALTFDAVDQAGRHLGGLIAPGLVTAQNAVRSATHFEIRPQAARYEAGLGQDTESCVRQGALHACAGLIERAARGRAGPRLITGGDAGALLPHLDPTWGLRPNLVLEGLLAFAEWSDA